MRKFVLLQIREQRIFGSQLTRAVNELDTFDAYPVCRTPYTLYLNLIHAPGLVSVVYYEDEASQGQQISQFDQIIATDISLCPSQPPFACHHFYR